MHFHNFAELYLSSPKTYYFLFCQVILRCTFQGHWSFLSKPEKNTWKGALPSVTVGWKIVWELLFTTARTFHVYIIIIIIIIIILNIVIPTNIVKQNISLFCWLISCINSVSNSIFCRHSTADQAWFFSHLGTGNYLCGGGVGVKEGGSRLFQIS